MGGSALAGPRSRQRRVAGLCAAILALVGLNSVLDFVDAREAGPVLPDTTGLQAGQVSAAHRNGQTFITWREVDPQPPDALTFKEFQALKRSLAPRRIQYRIYRSSEVPARVSAQQLIGEVEPFSAWNGGRNGVSPPLGALVTRYVIEEGKPPLPAGTGLFVHTIPRPGSAYYYVTTVEAGTENTALSPANMVHVAGEQVRDASPVLQRIEKPAEFVYIRNPTLRFYVRWEAGRSSAISGQPFDYLVAIPPGLEFPAPVGIHLHAWGGSMMTDFGWWYSIQGTPAVLVSTNQVPYDWWTGYHEKFGDASLRTPEDWRRGVVRPYTQTRLLSFVDWLGTTMQLDSTRTFTAGTSMGGSGALMLAIRHPSRIAWSISWVGVHIPASSPKFRGSYESVFGKPEYGVKFEDGTPVWDYYDDAWYLRRYPDRDIGYLTFANGKNDAGIGWPQAVEFLKALQETRQPHMFVWGQGGHGQRARMPANGNERDMPLDIRTDRSLPAFTRSTLDDDPGSGAPDRGAPQGQVNAYLTWQPATIVDEPDKWSVSIGVDARSPRAEGSVDVTPRRLQRFKPRPGEIVQWSSSRGSLVIQRGEAIVDRWGLITLPGVMVSRDGTQVVVTRKPF